MAEDQNIRRREFLARLGYLAGAAAGMQAGLVLLRPSQAAAAATPALPGQAVAGAKAVRTIAPKPSAPNLGFSTPGASVRQLFGRLVPGSRIGRWTLVAVHDVRMGAIPVLLRDRHGETFQVDIVRRETGLIATTGVSNTPSLSLFLVNGGDGRTRTEEEHGLGAMALGSVLTRREKLGAPIPQLLTLRQRNSSFPNGAYGLLA